MTYDRMTSTLSAIIITLVLGASRIAAAACPSCGTSPCTISGTSTIASGTTCNYAGKDVILTGTLQGDNNAACYTVVANSLTVRGTLRARSSCVDVQVAGNFKMEVVSNSAATVDVRNANDGGDGLFVTCGSATLNGNGINADADGSASYFWAGGIVVTCTGDVTGNGGSLHALGAGGDSGGSIEITSSEGSIDLASAFDVSGAGEYSDGGSIAFDANGDVSVGTASRSLQAQSAQGGTGGFVGITAGGSATVNGAVNVNGNGTEAYAGDIEVAASSLSTGTVWNARGDVDGAGGGIDVRALDGAGTVTTAASASWNVNGSGINGGSIYVGANGTVSLSGDMDATGSGIDTWGGDIWIETDGDMTVASTSRLDADATGGDAADGTVTLKACNVTIAGGIDTRGVDLFGHNDLIYAGTLTQSAGSALYADDGYGNNITCRCVDTTPADGNCDSPAACVSNPTLSGTVNPTAVVTPMIMASCS